MYAIKTSFSTEWPKIKTCLGVLLGHLEQAPERPSTNLSNPAEWLFAGNESKTGIAVTEKNAMQLSAVFGAVRVISETIATLPYHVKQSTNGMVRNAEAHPINKLIHAPNSLMSDFTFRETCQANLCLHGNAYIAIKRDNAGNPIKLIPISPERVSVKIYEDEKFYQIDDKETFNDSEMIHIVGLGFDGVVGKSVIECARESIGLGLAAIWWFILWKWREHFGGVNTPRKIE